MAACGAFATECPQEASALFDCDMTPEWACAENGDVVVGGNCAAQFTNCLQPCIQQMGP